MRWDYGYRITRVLAKFGTYSFCAYCIYQSIVALAGTSTDLAVSIWLWLETSRGFTISASLTIAALAMIYGWGERSLRQRTVARLQKRLRELEKKIDPERSSSGLTPHGRTNPDDE
jgi:hypothetical protein